MALEALLVRAAGPALQNPKDLLLTTRLLVDCWRTADRLQRAGLDAQPIKSKVERALVSR